MKPKEMRQARIRELLERDLIDTHEKMAQALAARSIEVSQSTLSKDLRELGVVRVPRPDGGFRYALPEAGVTLRDRRILERELGDYLLGVDRADNMVVVKTVSGHAQSVCEAIDRMGWEEILGTLAGENTIFALARTAEEGSRIASRLQVGGAAESEEAT